MNETQTLEATPATIPIGGRARATVLFIEALKDGKPGDSLTDAKAAQISGEPMGITNNVEDVGRPHLRSAMNYCEREFGVVWLRFFDEHRIVCISDVEKIDLAHRERRHIHRRSKRAMRVLAAVDTANLTVEQRRDHLIATAIQGTMIEASSAKTVKRLGQDNNPQPLDMHKLLAAMRTTDWREQT